MSEGRCLSRMTLKKVAYKKNSDIADAAEDDSVTRQLGGNPRERLLSRKLYCKYANIKYATTF